MAQKISFKKYLSVYLPGFGLAGLLWGLVLYLELPDLNYPFHYLSLLIVPVLGGISLAWFSKSIKAILKSIFSVFLGMGLGYVALIVFYYYLYLYSSLCLTIIPFLSHIEVELFKKLINLKPDIFVGSLWLAFFIIGALIALFYSLFLKTKKWALIWRGGAGLGLGALAGPVLGNLSEMIFNSLLLNYLLTFCLMNLTFALFLAWGVSKNE